MVVDNSAYASRADEVDDLINAVKDLIVPFVQSADDSGSSLPNGHGLAQNGSAPRTALVEPHPPRKLASLFPVDLPSQPGGKAALLSTIQSVLQYSVNTWHPGFLDKLYASTNAPGVVAELLLAVLNTNVHVYTVSPALTIVEKRVSRALANMVGFNSKWAGGVSQPGGSASNATSIIAARNTLFPETKTQGISGKKFVMFTSAHGHYSLEKAGQMFGFGSDSVRGVPVDAEGCMKPAELRRMVQEARQQGEEPFYVNATAGTTVLGSFDKFDEIADVCQEEKLWMHVDGSWGGPVAFSQRYREKLKGVERADSMGFTPHKMLAVPMTCSFLLVNDVRKLQRAMTLKAGYLFHTIDDDSEAAEGPDKGDVTAPTDDDNTDEYWDLADLTPQCGRRGDALKMALGWIYYGSEGYEQRIDSAFEVAEYMAKQVQGRAKFELVSQCPPPCWQVCFYYDRKDGDAEGNSRTTEMIAKRLVRRGFMVDYAPGENGKFFRVVVNGQTQRSTIDGMLKAIEDLAVELEL